MDKSISQSVGQQHAQHFGHRVYYIAEQWAGTKGIPDDYAAGPQRLARVSQLAWVTIVRAEETACCGRLVDPGLALPLPRAPPSSHAMACHRLASRKPPPPLHMSCLHIVSMSVTAPTKHAVQSSPPAATWWFGTGCSSPSDRMRPPRQP